MDSSIAISKGMHVFPHCGFLQMCDYKSDGVGPIIVKM